MMYLKPADLAKLFRTAHAAETPKSRLHHLAMLTQFFTGTRVSQLLDLRGEDVFEKDGVWVVMIRAAKRGNVVTHALHLDADPAFDMSPLIELARTMGPSKLFGGLSRAYYDSVLKRIAEAAGVHESFAHSHVFRHSAAMAVFDGTKRIGAVQNFLGHRSPSSSLIYLQENDGALAQSAMNNLRLGTPRPALENL